jgi:hypothetical protein
MVFNNNLLLGAAGAAGAGGYTIPYSARFNSVDSSYLYRTPAVVGNQTTWTWSGWVKLGKFSGQRSLFASYGTSVTWCTFSIDPSGDLFLYHISGASDYGYYTAAVIRDPSAWYSVILCVDTTQATAANRVKLYINGIQQVLTPSYGDFPQNYSTFINYTFQHRLGSNPDVATYFDGYLSEVNFIDGQALTPSSFGEVNSDTGQWQAKEYEGAYGTNGFYLDFADSGALGTDVSGNANTFTTSGLTSADQLTDTPTDNFPTLNPLATGMAATLSDGNLAFSFGGDDGAPATFATGSTGSYRFRVNITTLGAVAAVAVITPAAYDAITNWGNINLGAGSGQYAYRSNGDKYSGGSAVAYGASFTSSDYVEAEYDANEGTLVFYKNGTTQGTAYTGLSGPMFFAISRNASGGGSVIGTVDFGQLGTVGDTNVLSTATLPDPTIADPSAHFNSVAYAGDGSIGRSIDAGLATDLVWIKERDGASDHALFDQVRGALKNLSSNTTGAETTSLANTDVSAFNSSGVVVNPSYFVNVNSSGFNYISWHWKANGAGSSNTDGSINTTATSVNTTAGFSISTYTGTGSNATVGHGLGIAPKMVIVKRRDSTSSWRVYHAGLTSAAYVLNMESTDAEGVNATVWNSTDPTSSVFSIGTNAEVNTSGGTYVAYCFAEVEGFSKFGSYTGNGSSNGPFVYCGFRPAMIICKKSSSAGNDWVIFDNQRDTYNVGNHQLKPNTSEAEFSGGTAHQFDFVSNGFKFRSTGSDINTSGATYIFMAFAESPFKTANAR